jgi:hypothetical protein
MWTASHPNHPRWQLLLLGARCKWSVCILHSNMHAVPLSISLGRDHRLKAFDNQPLKIYGFPSTRTKVVSLACGALHCLALTMKGVRNV